MKSECIKGSFSFKPQEYQGLLPKAAKRAQTFAAERVLKLLFRK